MSDKMMAFTCSHGNRRFMYRLTSDARTSPGADFDWVVFLSAPDEGLARQAKDLLDKGKIQKLVIYPENRGQHHATKDAIEYANQEGYKWLLRLDDDIQFLTKDWLIKMLNRLEYLKDISGDSKYHWIAGPKVIGLNNPIRPIGTMEHDGDFPVDLVDRLGGACRLHPMSLIADYIPDLYAPIGRMDPDLLAIFLKDREGSFIRFPDIRILHHTNELENMDDPRMKALRTISHGWCYLGKEV